MSENTSTETWPNEGTLAYGVLDLMRKTPGIGPSEMAEVLGTHPGSVGSALTALREKNMITRVGRGQYELAKANETPPKRAKPPKEKASPQGEQPKEVAGSQPSQVPETVEASPLDTEIAHREEAIAKLEELIGKTRNDLYVYNELLKADRAALDSLLASKKARKAA